MYLVLLRHTIDDLPVRLCATRDEAVAAASALSWEPDDRVRETFSTDCSTPCAIAIVEFDEQGRPASLDTVRRFHDEEEQCTSNR